MTHMERSWAFLILLLWAVPSQAAIQLYYLHNDHLGTPRVVTNQAQAVVWKGKLKPFGETGVEVEAITNHRRFPGQRLDIESRLHYNYFRDYDPGIGRYIQSDPIGLAGGLNTFTYVGGNPISHVDSLGLATLMYESGTLTVARNTGEVRTYPAGNNTTNPNGDRNTVGSNGPAPHGIFPVQPPVNTVGRPEYGSAFFPVGAVGPNGQRLDIARQRGIGIHSGRRDYQSITQGCLRVDESTIQDLLRINRDDPITEITIR